MTKTSQRTNVPAFVSALLSTLDNWDLRTVIGPADGVVYLATPTLCRVAGDRPSHAVDGVVISIPIATSFT
jgi:hypothetical protein